MTGPKKPRRPTRFDPTEPTELDKLIATKRDDPSFQARLWRRLREDAEVLRRLARGD